MTLRECFFVFENFFVKSVIRLQNIVAARHKGPLPACNIATGGELLLNLGET
jgi:hypothetical protein